MVKEEKGMEIKLSPLNLGSFKVKIKGKTPLIMDKMPADVKQGIIDKQTGVSKTNKKKIRNIDSEIELAIHKTNDNRVGFPSYGFKKGMMESTGRLGDKFFSKKLVSGAMKLIGTVDGLIPLKYEKQDVIQHTVKGQTKFSPQFHDWSCVLNIEYEKNNITKQDIVTLLNYAGFYVGVGANRPLGRDGGSGDNGMYEVEVKNDE